MRGVIGISGDNDDESDGSSHYDSRLYLNPRDVIALASTIPNCDHITPPAAVSETSAANRRPSPNFFLQSKRSSDSTSYFSQISCHLNETFSIDNDDHDEQGGREQDVILSFLVSDAYSIDQLVAEAEGRVCTTNPLDGMGVARIDVYCQSGTVCTSRLIQTSATSADTPHDNSKTPRQGNVTTAASSSNSNLQFRRLIRQKCNLDTLRCILTQPPKFPEINSSVIRGPSSVSNADDGDDNSQCSTVSKKLRLRRKNRLADKFAFLSPEQQKFLKEQKKMYEKRLRQDEKVRRSMAHAILAGGINESETELNLPSLDSLSLNDAVNSALTIETAETSETINTTTTILPYYRARQQLIQDKLEIADVGLAILMAEAQRLKRIMKEIENDERDETDGNTKSDTETERSYSTYHSTDHEDEDGTQASIMPDDSDTLHTIQGCEVEYSFPHEFHDVLESALLGENDDEESSDSDDSSSSSSAGKKTTKTTRGRSPPRDVDHDGKKSRTSLLSERKENLPPIVAVPTNGHGCIVLRQDGSFDVVGKIPYILRKKLFRHNGPLPDYISLGTQGRYYVHFHDGSFYFYGPPPLTRIMKKVNRYQRRIKHPRKGKGNNETISVVSVSFGKKLDDIFVVLSNGAWEAHGDIPKGLEMLTKERNDRADLLWAAIGNNGEWCVKSINGNVWWGNVTEEADESLSKIAADDLMYVDFGIDGSYFLLYN